MLSFHQHLSQTRNENVKMEANQLACQKIDPHTCSFPPLLVGMFIQEKIDKNNQLVESQQCLQVCHVFRCNLEANQTQMGLCKSNIPMQM